MEKTIKTKKGTLTKILEAISPETKTAFLRIEYYLRDAGLVTTGAVFSDKSNLQKMDCRWGRREGRYLVSWGFHVVRAAVLPARKAYAMLTFFFRCDDEDVSRRGDSIVLEYHPERGWIADLFMSEGVCPPEIEVLLPTDAGTRLNEGMAIELIEAIVKCFLQHAREMARVAASTDPANDNGTPPEEPFRPAS